MKMGAREHWSRLKQEEATEETSSKPEEQSPRFVHPPNFLSLLLPTTNTFWSPICFILTHSNFRLAIWGVSSLLDWNFALTPWTVSAVLSRPHPGSWFLLQTHHLTPLFPLLSLPRPCPGCMPKALLQSNRGQWDTVSVGKATPYPL